MDFKKRKVKKNTTSDDGNDEMNALLKASIITNDNNKEQQQQNNNNDDPTKALIDDLLLNQQVNKKPRHNNNNPFDPSEIGQTLVSLNMKVESEILPSSSNNNNKTNNNNNDDNEIIALGNNNDDEDDNNNTLRNNKKRQLGSGSNFTMSNNNDNITTTSSTAHRVQTTIDYAPDICKDYKQFGYCRWGDACKFIHDRGQTKTSNQMDLEWEKHKAKKTASTNATKNQLNALLESINNNNQQQKQDNTNNIPLNCTICEEKLPNKCVVTLCGHYFCSPCALQRYTKQNEKTCAICNVDTKGRFKPYTITNED